MDTCEMMGLGGCEGGIMDCRWVNCHLDWVIVTPHVFVTYSMNDWFFTQTHVIMSWVNWILWDL